MCVYVYVYIYMYMYVYVYIYTHTYIYKSGKQKIRWSWYYKSKDENNISRERMPVITEVRLEEYFPGFWFQQVFILLKIMENLKGLYFLGCIHQYLLY